MIFGIVIPGCDHSYPRIQDTRAVNQDPGLDSGQDTGICKYCVTHGNRTSPTLGGEDWSEEPTLSSEAAFLLIVLTLEYRMEVLIEIFDQAC